MSQEERVTNEITGGQKGTKAERFDLLPWEQLAEVARLYAKGAEKYEPYNWQKGYNWSLSFAALMRHAVAFWQGESKDPELGTHHLASVVFHALALMYFERYTENLDDRPVPRHRRDRRANSQGTVEQFANALANEAVVIADELSAEEITQKNHAAIEAVHAKIKAKREEAEVNKWVWR